MNSCAMTNVLWLGPGPIIQPRYKLSFLYIIICTLWLTVYTVVHYFDISILQTLCIHFQQLLLYITLKSLVYILYSNIIELEMKF